jgi:hypothetical protein
MWCYCQSNVRVQGIQAQMNLWLGASRKPKRESSGIAKHYDSAAFSCGNEIALGKAFR